MTLRVSNDSAARVSEAELLTEGRILGEKENLTPGLSGEFTLRLDAGDYTILCPNATDDSAAFTVTGEPAQKAGTEDASLSTAVSSYTACVQNQVAALVVNTRRFTGAVKAKKIGRVRQLYAPARTYYERIEPVAESFGDLDPDLDARVNDVEDPANWTGFHRLEKALWPGGSLRGMTPIATKLMTDVRDLQTRVKTVKLQPAQIANGAVDLLGEVAEMMAGKQFGGATAGQLAPPADTGEAVGLLSARLTVTVGFGPSLFDHRFGLADRRPAALAPLPALPGDELDPERSHGDISVQACADDPQVAFHAIRNFARLGFGTVAMRWSQLGFGRTSSTSKSQVTPRNLMGFKTAPTISMPRTPRRWTATSGSAGSPIGPGCPVAPTSSPGGSGCRSRPGTATRCATRRTSSAAPRRPARR